MFDDDEPQTTWTRARDWCQFAVIGFAVFAFCLACDFADAAYKLSIYKAAWSWLR